MVLQLMGGHVEAMESSVVGIDDGVSRDRVSAMLQCWSSYPMIFCPSAWAVLICQAGRPLSVMSEHPRARKATCLHVAILSLGSG